jgi:hypothetical protein
VTWLAPRPDTIPAELRRRPWVLWASEPDESGGKPRKVPRRIAYPNRAASSVDSASWGTFSDACEAYSALTEDRRWAPLRIAGIGVVLVGNGLVCVDLDGAITPEGLTPAAATIVREVPTFTEVSASGHGLHLWVSGTLARAVTSRTLEAWDRGRYVCVTGERYPGTPPDVEPSPRLIKLLDEASMPEPHTVGPVRKGAGPLRVRRQTPIAEGSRDTSLFRIAAGLVAQGTSGDALVTALMEANARLCNPQCPRPKCAASPDPRVAMKRDPDQASTIAGGLATMRPPPPSEPYRFASAFPADHFVTAFMDYAAECTDAAHEFFEAGGLVCLATVTPNVRARLRQYPNGLPTALYAMLIGDSTRSRKSTAKNLVKDLLHRVLPDALLAEHSSPEAFVEQLAERSGDSTAWLIDEIGETIDRLHHQTYLAGLRGILLELYEGGDYTYKRTTKKRKGGQSVKDELRIEQVHLSVLGCTTPSLFEILTARDINSGFLARFAVVMPERKPARRPFYEAGEGDERARNLLTKRLHEIMVWAASAVRRVSFEDDALVLIDRFCEQLEDDEGPDRAAAMLQRLGAMTIKLAMLAAIGRPEAPDHDALVVSPQDAEIAVTVATRWKRYALAVADRVGENELERTIERCLSCARKRGPRVNRREVARAVHLAKDVLDKVQATLEDRGHIAVTVAKQSGPDSTTWAVLD